MGLSDLQINERRPDLAALDHECCELQKQLVALGTTIAGAQVAASDAEAEARAEIAEANAVLEAAKRTHAAAIAAAQSKARRANNAVAKLASDQELASRRRQAVKRLYSDGCEDEQRVFAAEEAIRVAAEEAERKAAEEAERKAADEAEQATEAEG